MYVDALTRSLRIADPPGSLITPLSLKVQKNGKATESGSDEKRFGRPW